MQKNQKEKNRPEAVFHPEFLDDLGYWAETDRRVLLRVLDLVLVLLVAHVFLRHQRARRSSARADESLRERFKDS